MECQFVPHDLAADFRAAGWQVKPMRGYAGLYSMLAWRAIEAL